MLGQVPKDKTENARRQSYGIPRSRYVTGIPAAWCIAKDRYTVSLSGKALADKCSSDARGVKRRNSEGPGPTLSLQQNNTSVQILIEAFRTKQAHSCWLWCGRCGKCYRAGGIFDSRKQRGGKTHSKPGKRASFGQLKGRSLF